MKKRLFHTDEVEVGIKKLFMSTHHSCHLEEIGSMWAIINFGSSQWYEKYCPKGKILIGTGGGFSDDHVQAGRKTSSMKLIVETMSEFSADLKNDKALKRIVDYFTRMDNVGNKATHGFYSVFWKMQKMWPEQVDDNISWALAALDELYYQRSAEFDIKAVARVFEDRVQGKVWLSRALFAVDEYRKLQKAAETELISALSKFRAARRTGDRDTDDVMMRVISKKTDLAQEEVKILSISSDSICMPEICLNSPWGNADLVIVRKSSGHCLIMPRNGLKQIMPAIAADIMAFESDRWHFYEQAGWLMNGSLTNPDVLPSDISRNHMFLIAWGHVYEHINKQ